MNTRELLLYLTLKLNGDWDNILDFIKKKCRVDKNELENYVNGFSGNYITLLDPEYPECLKTSRKPPFVLFYKGDINLLSSPRHLMLGVIGARNNTDYGLKNCRKIVKELDENVIIISGLAKGIDGIAHQAAMECKKRTIAVLGCAINKIYPSDNSTLYDDIVRNNGVIISEYGPNVETGCDNFLLRNRIIASLADTLLVIESYARSGCMSTVSFALEENRNICCLPFCANEQSNCNRLIKEGAYLVESAKDVEEILNP